MLTEVYFASFNVTPTRFSPGSRMSEGRPPPADLPALRPDSVAGCLLMVVRVSVFRPLISDSRPLSSDL